MRRCSPAPMPTDRISEQLSALVTLEGCGDCKTVVVFRFAQFFGWSSFLAFMFMGADRARPSRLAPSFCSIAIPGPWRWVLLLAKASLLGVCGFAASPISSC